jgi:hypothetical protein
MYVTKEEEKCIITGEDRSREGKKEGISRRREQRRIPND